VDLILSQFFQNAFLELFNLLWREHISFGNERYKINSCLECFHKLNVDGSQAVAAWIDEIKTAMNSIVDNMASVESGLIV
jgi:hypothetical protein